MRRRTASEPLWRGRGKWGQGGGRAGPLHPPPQRGPGAALLPAQVASVVAQLGAREHDLQHALPLAGQHLPDDVFDGPAALAAAGAGDDAEGAELVAALLDADEGAGA